MPITVPVTATHVVRPGERYYTRERLQIEPDVNAAIEILHEDAALIVVNKPAPLPMHPSGRYHRNTLEWILRDGVCAAEAAAGPPARCEHLRRRRLHPHRGVREGACSRSSSGAKCRSGIWPA